MEKMRDKKQLKNGNYSGFARQFYANTESDNVDEPGIIKIIVDCLVGPLFYIIGTTLLAYFMFSSSERPMVLIDEFHTYGCNTMIEKLNGNQLAAKKFYVNKGIKVIGCQVDDIGKNGEIDVKPIEGMFHTSGIKLLFKYKDKGAVETLQKGDRCVVWGVVRDVTDSPFPDYIMEVMDIRITR